MSPIAPTTQKRRPLQPPTRGSSTINFFLILITLVAGIIAWIIDALIYEMFLESIPRPVLIGITFAVLYFILVIVVFAYSNASGTFETNVITGTSDFISTVMILLIATVAVFGAASLFQWIYGLNFTHEMQEPTSYVFIIDDSGSMEANDPNQLRYSAIQTVLSGLDDHYPYMVYSFSDDVDVTRGMAPIADGTDSLTGNSYGGTAIRAALSRVIEDYSNGIWSGGDAPKVILLTDGYATDIGFFSSINSVLKKYVKNGLNISTVGLGDVDSGLMTQIAKTTGGVFIDVSDASQLTDAMTSAAAQYTDRDLFSARFTTSLNFLYGLLRIVFLTLLGLMVGFIVSVAYGRRDSAVIISISSLIKSFSGALLMELGTTFGASEKVAWFILWLLIALTIAEKNASVSRRVSRPTHRRNKSSRKLAGF